MLSCWKFLMFLVVGLSPLLMGCSAQMSQSAADRALEEQEKEETDGDADDTDQEYMDEEDFGDSGDADDSY